MSSSARLQVKPSEWDLLLKDLSSKKAALFHEDAVDEESVSRFMKPTGAPSQVYLLPATSRLFFFQDFYDGPSKESALGAAERHLERFSPLAREKDRLMMILEELLLNATISAPRAAGEEGRGEISGPSRLRVEWDERRLWIHVSDPYGSFVRGNFEQSFRPDEENRRRTHGHSGRGLRIIFDRVQDLWIRSRPDWGTVVSVGVSLGRGGDDRKTLLADFP